MDRISLGRTGLDVSVLGCGTATITLLEERPSCAVELLNLLLDSGVNLIDTAALYGPAETMITDAVGHRREEMVIVSKCGPKVDWLEGEEWSPGLIAQSIDATLHRLKTDCVEVMLLHTCDLPTLKQGDALGAIVKARDAGKVRFAGFAGDNEDVAHAVTMPDVDVIETSVNVFDQSNIDTVLPGARAQNVGVLAKRTMAGGAWRQANDRPGFYRDYASVYEQRMAATNVTPADLGVDASWPEIAVRFTLSHPGVHCAIAGMISVDEARLNIAAAEKGPLPPEVVQQLRDAFRAAETQAGEKWTGQT